MQGFVGGKPQPGSKRAIWFFASVIASAMILSSTVAAWAQGGALPVRIAYYASSSSSIPIYVAQAKGFFAQHGIAAELVQFASGSAAGTALLAGAVDIAPLGVEEMAPMSARGESVKAILGNWAVVGTSIMARSDEDWPSQKQGYPAVMHDLKGKTIGITGPNSLSDYALRSLLADTGMKASDINIVPVGGAATALAAFTARQIDAYVATDPLGADMEARNIGVRLVNIGAGDGPKLLQEYTANCVAAKAAWVKQHPEEASRLAQAFIETDHYIRGFPSHVDDDLKLLTKYFPGVAEPTLRKTLLLAANWYNPIITQNQVANVNKVLLGFGVLKTPVLYQDAVDTTFMPKSFP